MKHLLLALALLCTLPTQANLLISPHRLVIEPGRGDSVLLKNTSGETQKFEISLIDKVMDTNGQIKTIESSPHSLKSMLRYSPRRVTLAPGESQTIRLALRLKRDAEDGEYRSHLQMKQIPTPATFKGQDSEEALQFAMRPLMAMSIPIIARKGDTRQQLQFEELSRAPTELTLKLNAQGNRSIYGRLTLHQQQNGELVELGSKEGIVFYRETLSREIQIPLKASVNNDTPIELHFKEAEEYGGDLDIRIQI